MRLSQKTKNLEQGKSHRYREQTYWGEGGGGGFGEGSSEGDKEVLREASNVFGKCHRLLGNRT